MENIKNWILLDYKLKFQSQPLNEVEVQFIIDQLSSQDSERYFLWTEGWSHWKSFNKLSQEQLTPFSWSSIINKPQDNFSQKPHDHYFDETVVTQTFSEPIVQINEEAFEMPDGMQNEKTNFDPLTLVNTSEDKNLFSDDPVGKQDFKSEELKQSADSIPLNFSTMNQTNYKDREKRHELKIEVVLHSKNNKTFRTYSKNISLSGTLIEDNAPFDFLGYNVDLVVVNRNAKNQQHSRVQVKAEVIVDGKNNRIKFLNMSDQQKTKLTELLDDYMKESEANKAV